MRPVRFVLQPLLDLFQRLRAVTMPEMKTALGTRVDMTVFRKLASLDYLTSYSHRGGYYTLKSIPRFDARGIWLARGAWFSRHGTLLQAAAAAVREAPAGYVASELEAVLHVPVKDALLQLTLAGRLQRHDFHGLYLYTARERARRREQRAARQALRERVDEEPDQERAAIVLFYSLLDEQQRRLYAGLESLKQGHGGDRKLAQRLGLDEETVARGRRELLEAKVQRDRVRQPGGGRPRAEKKTPDLLKSLASLLREDTAGDPTGRRRLWTGKRLAQITRELRELDIAVSPRTVRRLLDQLGYGLHANTKSLSPSHEQRDQQFRCIARQKKRFARSSLPVISVDTKKKELVGNFKNPGRVWSLAATAVKDHDFRSEAQGMAIPYGIYDVAANRGSVFVGTSHDTPEFAAGNVARWWREVGCKNYADASQLLILADSGGSNGARVRAWKYALQELVADHFDLKVTVCHYPAGASKWNPIEHRLFSEISKHWAGQPLDSYQTILSLIAETKTQTGLQVKSHLISKHFEVGKKISAEQMSQLRLVKHNILPQWNYSLLPRQNPN